MLLEYKLFEPAFYTTDVPGLGHGLRALPRAGRQAQVVLDTGHHAPGTNIEFIVALLLRAGRLGAFDFNCRFYADDDLMVGAADPFQLFRIMHESCGAARSSPGSGVAFMLDQCHNIEPKIPGQIRSVMNVQEATAKALLVDQEALGRGAAATATCSGANAVLMDAYDTDVRPLLAELREDDGPGPRSDARPTPRSGYAERIAAERVGGQPGRMGRMTTRSGRPVEELLGRSQPAGRGPAQHELRRRQHVGQRHGDRPGDRRRRSSCCGSRAPAATSAR